MGRMQIGCCTLEPPLPALLPGFAVGALCSFAEGGVFFSSRSKKFPPLRLLPFHFSNFGLHRLVFIPVQGQLEPNATAFGVDNARLLQFGHFESPFAMNTEVRGENCRPCFDRPGITRSNVQRYLRIHRGSTQTREHSSGERRGHPGEVVHRQSPVARLVSHRWGIQAAKRFERARRCQGAKMLVIRGVQQIGLLVEAVRA
mmetsp:Transcript_2572/g.4834  ORF Transcript_2572/g.4834 Transcript_2572/m.4834 type:complete len:201 (-) Transcript_2572:1397-1999(-)